jgi:hypothetical protein
MKNQSWPILTHSEFPAQDQETSLYQLVNRLLAALLPQSTGKKTVIINDVDKKHSIPVDQEILAFVIGSIMSNEVYSTSNCCIRVETIIRQDGIDVRVRNNGEFRYSSSLSNLRPIADAARKIGGHIGLQHEENYGMSVVLSLSGQNVA